NEASSVRSSSTAIRGAAGAASRHWLRIWSQSMSVLQETLFEQLPQARHANGHRIDAQPQHLGHVLARQAFKIEQQHAALHRVEHGEEGVEHREWISGMAAITRLGDVVERVIVATRLAHMAECGIERHAVQPGGALRAAIETVEA